MSKRIISIGVVLLMLSVSMASMMGFVGEVNAANGNFGGGDGSAGNPYIIEDVRDLQNMNSDLNAHYALNNSIDASITSTWNSGAGFAPVGSNISQFNGSLDGRGYTIFNLTINRSSEDYVGLFGYVGSPGRIVNVSLENANITGNDWTGFLIGMSHGDISFSHSTGSMSGHDWVAGLIGRSYGNLTGDSADVSVVGNTRVAGLAGESNGAYVNDSHSAGSVSASGDRSGGLFAYSTSSISNCYSTVDVRSNGNQVGGLVGENHGPISRSHATGTVELTDKYGSSYGGLVGDNENTISDSFATGDVLYVQAYSGGLAGYSNGYITHSFATGDVEGKDNCHGGLVGYMNSYSVSVDRCYATGNVGGERAVGGLIGLKYGSITNSYSTGRVTIYGTGDVGGLVGSKGSGSENNCFWDNQTSGMDTSNGTETGLNTTEMMNNMTFIDAGWDLNSTWYMVNGSTRPFLRMEWSTEIVTSHQIQLMQMNLSADYTLANDIDMDVTNPANMWGTNSTDGKGFLPIAYDTDLQASKHQGQNFTGSLDGAGHSISGLYISRLSAQYVGLFSCMDSMSAVHDLHLTDTNVSGNLTVGGLAALAYGVIENCSADGTSMATDETAGVLFGSNYGYVNDSASSGAAKCGDQNVGGLGGYNYGHINRCHSNASASGGYDVGGLIGQSNGGRIYYSYSNGRVSASYQRAGGIVGQLNGGGSVERSFSTGDVSGPGGNVDSRIGGAVGDMNGYGIAEECYATGTVNGGMYVGGFVGRTYNANLSNCYATGAVNGYSYVGGFVGVHQKDSNDVIQYCYSIGNVTGSGGGFCGMNLATITDSFWDNETSGLTSSSGGSGRYTSEMKQQATFTGWNFTNIWGIYETNSYPFLRALGPTYIPSADLNLSMEVSPSPVAQLGGCVHVYVNITNEGPDNALNVNVTMIAAGADMEPENITVSDGNITPVDDGISWNIDILGPGETARLLVNLTANGSGMFYLNGTSFSDIADPVQGNNASRINILINTVPVAVNDTATTDEDTPASIDVLANDYDADNDTLTIINVTQGNHGTVTFNESGNVTYTPNPNWNGVDSFNYTISDGNEGYANATVTVTVTPVNDAPVAVNDTANTSEDTSVTIDVLANDSDVDGDSLTITEVTQASHGTVAIIDDGKNVTYTPDANWNGVDTFTYTISDGKGGYANATVTVTVTPVNEAPVAVNDTATTDEDTPASIDVLANDYDADNDTLSITEVTQGAHGTVAIIDDGKNVTYTPEENWNGEDSFTYTISDGNGGTSSAAVSITVKPVNDAPIAVNDTANTSEDTSVTIDVLANDYDVDGDEIAITNVTQGNHGTVTFNESGNVTYTPDAKWIGVDTFTYTISDGKGGYANATVTVTVTPVNEAPVAVNDTATTDEDTSVTIDVLANDSDVDGDSLTITNVSQGAHGTVAIIDDGKNVTYTPDANWNGVDTFTYTISDGNGGYATASVSVTVTPVNNNPVIITDSLPNGTVGTEYSVELNATDVDGDSLTWTLESDAGFLSIENGYLTGMPDAAGTYHVNLTVSDGKGGSAERDLMLNVEPSSNESGTVIGTVVDANGDPVAGASVSVSGTNISTSTDANGKYSLTVPAGEHSLVISAENSSKTLNVTVSDGKTTDAGKTTLTLAPGEASEEGSNMMLYLFILALFVVVISALLLGRKKDTPQPSGEEESEDEAESEESDDDADEEEMETEEEPEEDI